MKLSHLEPLHREQVIWHIDQARGRWGRATPFRVGLVAGEDSDSGSNPYTAPKARQHWAQGVEHSSK